MFYLLLFAVTSLIFYFAQKCYAKWPVLFWSLCYFGIFVLAFVAGARDNSIGTDIHVYGLNSWQIARSYEGDLLESADHDRREFIFCAINQLAVILSDKFGLALFFICLAMQVPMLYAMKRYMDIVPLWLTMLAYNLYFYNLSLNMMCQGIAVAFFVWAMKFIEMRRLGPLVVCLVVCFFIHHVAAIAGLVALGIYWILGKPDEKLPKYFFMSIALALGGLLVFSIVVEWAADNIPLMGQYRYYGSEESGHFKSSVSTVDTLFRIGMLCAVLIFGRMKLIDDVKFVYFLSLLLLADITSQLLGLYVFYATRIGYFFVACEMPLFLVFLAKCRIKSGTRYIAYSLFVIFLLYYCIRFYYVKGDNQTYPYSSEFLGI